MPEAIGLCLVAGASRSDVKEWKHFVGEWLSELAFGELTDEEGLVLHSHLLALLHVLPELWLSCGRAEAALCAFNARQHGARPTRSGD
jgi:hypothetical protein